jgi:hypothetical protein
MLQQPHLPYTTGLIVHSIKKFPFCHRWERRIEAPDLQFEVTSEITQKAIDQFLRGLWRSKPQNFRSFDKPTKGPQAGQSGIFRDEIYGQSSNHGCNNDDQISDDSAC